MNVRLINFRPQGKTEREKRQFFIYTKDEADTLGIKYRIWDECDTLWEWGSTDDGYVSELYYYWSGDNHRGQPVKFWKFGAGRCFKNVRYKREPFYFYRGEQFRIDREARAARREAKKQKKEIEEALCTVATPRWLRNEFHQERFHKMIDVAAILTIAGKFSWEKVGRAWRHDDKKPGATARVFWRYKEVRQMYENKVAELLEARNVTREWVADTMKKITESALEKQDLTNARLSVENFAKMLDMYPKQTIKQIPQDTDVHDAEFSDVNPQMLAEERERALLKPQEVATEEKNQDAPGDTGILVSPS